MQTANTPHPIRRSAPAILPVPSALMRASFMRNTYGKNDGMRNIMNSGSGNYGRMVIKSYRTFTHSFLSLLLFSIAIMMICPPLVGAYVIGYILHLFLDVLNKKDVPLLLEQLR